MTLLLMECMQMMNPEDIKIGDYVVTSKGYTGYVSSVGTGQLSGYINVAIGSRNGNPIGVTVMAYDACKLPSPAAKVGR